MRVAGLEATIDRTSFVPFYHQLKMILREQIQSGAVGPGDALPSENELMRRYQVSRATVRRALGELVHEGVVQSVRGRGTFVARPKLEQSLFRFYSLGRDLSRRGFHLTSRVLTQASRRLPGDVARKLGAGAGEQGVEVTRVRLLDGEPLSLETSYVLERVCGALLAEDLTRRSIYDVIEQTCGHRVVRAEEYLEPIVLGPYEARRLETDEGRPAFYVERLTYGEGPAPLEIRRSVIRGDRYRFFVELR